MVQGLKQPKGISRSPQIPRSRLRLSGSQTSEYWSPQPQRSVWLPPREQTEAACSTTVHPPWREPAARGLAAAHSPSPLTWLGTTSGHRDSRDPGRLAEPPLAPVSTFALCLVCPLPPSRGSPVHPPRASQSPVSSASWGCNLRRQSAPTSGVFTNTASSKGAQECHWKAFTRRAPARGRKNA